VLLPSLSIIVTWQDDGDRKTTADPIGGAHLATKRFDITTHDPETEAGMRRRIAVALGRTRGEVAFEDTVDLLDRNAGAFVVDLQFDRVVILGQR